MFTRLFYSIFLLLFCLINSYGQESFNDLKNLKFKHISTKDGLSQSTVSSILQDSKGYLWFGTRDGLNKYDGTEFTNFKHNSEDNTSLTHSWVTCIFEDSYHHLWIGTKDGLNKYNPNKKNFTQYKKEITSINISDNEIWSITQTDNILWVATNNGITKINLLNEKISEIKASKNGLSDNRTRKILNTNNGYLWIASVSKIDQYNIKENKWSHYSYPESTAIDLNIKNPVDLYQDHENQMWLGHEKGLALLNKNSKNFEYYNSKNTETINSGVRSICEDNNRNLWVGTYNGLYIFNPKRTLFRNFVHDEYVYKSLSQNSIHQIIKDSKGDMWIGTWSGGVNYFDHSSHIFKQISPGASNTMLNYKVVSAIIEEPNGDYWIGTEGGGINYYHNKTGTFTYYTHNPKNPNTVSSNNIKSMIKDHEGNLWIGTHNGGLNYLNVSKKPYKFKHFDNMITRSNQTNYYRVLCLLEDKDHNIWIGTTSVGIIVYNRKKDEFIELDTKTKSVQSIIQSKNPDIIYTGGSNGLEKINIKTKKISKIYYSNQLITTKSHEVNCLYENGNTIWIGTEGKGLYEFNTETKSTTKYGISQGFLNEVIYGILPDNKNNLWISSNSGISSLNLKTKKIENFDEFDGLQGNEFNYGASLKKKNGELMFGGINGLNYFNPNDIVKNNFVPPVDIYGIKINNTQYINITDSISKINLDYNQNDFTIDFTALSYSQANKNKYAYKLEGFDLDWNNIGNKKTATYTNLDQGNYVFKVKAANNNGVWNNIGESINLKIYPAPWKTWWAYTIYFILIVALIYFIYRIVSIRIKEKNELKQEKLDKEKLEEINQLKLTLFTNISHDFRTPLTLITGPLQRMIQNKNGDDFVQKQHKIMHRNANMLLELINQLLDFRKSESGKQVLYASKSDIVSFSLNIKKAFDDLAEFNHFKFNFTSTESAIDIWFDKIKMKKILYNLLSNAFKYNQTNGEIAIKISTQKKQSKKYVVIQIINYGDIIPPKRLNQIFDRYYRFDKEGKQTGTGIGLALTKSLVELHHGKITATSSAEQGTCFKVIIPMGKKHLTKKECVQNNDDNLTIEKPFILEKEEAILNTPQPKETTIKDPDSETILLVEDNKDVRNFVKDIFKNKYHIYEANNGKEALEIAKNNNIQLIISDVMMPEMDGFELCQHLKTNIVTSHIPIILLTAKTATEHQKTGFSIGADAYVSKPFDATILDLRVHNLLNTRKNLISKFKKDSILAPKEITSSSADEEFLKKAIEVIEENITDSDFNVHEFTKQMHMSRSVIYRKTKALTDQSITEFIRTIKLKKAAQLISQTQMSISEIAYEIGFSDLKYFRSCFKKQFNTLPSAYRAENPLTDKNSNS